MTVKHPIICLLGPSASGKTSLAVEMVKRFPCDIISVDSAMVYKGMDIGTAKPDHHTLEIAPHRLIDMVDPAHAYSAGQFRTDALREIKKIVAQNRIPLLVGGTMMYFRILQQGLADLPVQNPALRQQLQMKANEMGWPALHKELAAIDPIAATRIHIHDQQRIQRALEVYYLTGEAITKQQQEDTSALQDYAIQHIALYPKDRNKLHEKIKQRFYGMLEQGFVKEVERLYERSDLSITLPSIRSVGYREMWAYLSSAITYDEMVEQALASTRQLAKRQMTWLRSFKDISMFDPDASRFLDDILKYINHDVFKG
ncbi:MAG: tRNA (adenosine(37)-N6)-dimethylallyltransferase MiaA [Gammaproteobacteria bacterium RIFCSPHIGHO2_12_FULL_38_14]|nr:MAG: tRNA (adenosine(37)-N6)-dimethylallyltransferase MiaA [Gammaproteobacteria bacterium RIFCSPHIGHO2_12_FULL_38_14]